DDPDFGCADPSCAPCDLPNATAVCAAGKCAIGACDADHDNCDGYTVNGCEVDHVSDSQNCGACGHACAFPNARPTCVSATCKLGPCTAKYQNCDGNEANGCESQVLFDPKNCGMCGNACAIGEQCEQGICGVFCDSGHANCDADPSNGCE